jgi:hypothetical protein
VQQSLGSTYNDPRTLTTRAIQRVIVATNGKITKEAHAALKAALRPSGLDTKIELIDGDRLWQLVSKYLPDRAIWQQLLDAQAVLANLSDDYRISVSVGDGGVFQIIYGPHPNRQSKEPLLAWSAQIFLPSTAEGSAVREALDQFYRTGATVKIDKEFIRSFTLPDPVRQIVGDVLVPDHVVLGQSPSPIATVDFEFEISDRSTTAILRNVGLQVKSRGAEQMTLNANSNSPWQVELICDLSTGETDFHLEVRWDDLNVHQQLEAALFATAMVQGGTLRARRVDTGAIILSGPQSECSDTGMTPQRVELMRTLLALQDATGVLLTLPSREITAAEVNEARATMEKIRTGAYKRSGGTARIMLSRSDARTFLESRLDPLNQIPLTITDEEFVDVFGRQVSLGTVTVTMTGAYLTTDQASVLRRVLDTSDGDPVPVDLTIPTGAELLAKYVQWPQ